MAIFFTLLLMPANFFCLYCKGCRPDSAPSLFHSSSRSFSSTQATRLCSRTEGTTSCLGGCSVAKPRLLRMYFSRPIIDSRCYSLLINQILAYLRYVRFWVQVHMPGEWGLLRVCRFPCNSVGEWRFQHPRSVAVRLEAPP